MLKSKFLLLELDKYEADFYHLPQFVPYLKKDQESLESEGFSWEKSIEAMKDLLDEHDFEEYKLYKQFIKKWDYYKALSNFIKEENWSEAEKTIDKILSIDLLDPSAYLNLGYISRVRRNLNKAEQSYLKGLELIANAVPFLTGLAKTYEELGKIDDAIYTWQQIVDLSEEGQREDALDMLAKHKVYKRVEKRDPKTKRKSFKYEPDENFERLMRKKFQRNYDEITVLTDLGLKLIEESYTKLAIKVFERVYHLSQLEGKEIPEHLKKLKIENEALTV
jgi:tetratricopeptide (TPR) repeat protein